MVLPLLGLLFLGWALVFQGPVIPGKILFGVHGEVPGMSYFVAMTVFFFEPIIQQFSMEAGIHPGIVVGRLQYDGLFKPVFQNNLNISITFPKNP